MHKPTKKKPPAAPPAPEIPESSTQSVIETLRREYAEADDRRREREQDIVEFHAWREALFAERVFLSAIEAMPDAERTEKAKLLVACLRSIWSVFHVPATPPRSKKNKPSSMSVNVDPQEVADDIRDLDSRVSMLEHEATLLIDDEAIVLRKIAARLRLFIEFHPTNLGTQAKALSSLQSGWNGWSVKELSERVPDRIKDRNAIISKLLKYAGANVSRQTVGRVLQSQQASKDRQATRNSPSRPEAMKR